MSWLMIACVLLLLSVAYGQPRIHTYTRSDCQFGETFIVPTNAMSNLVDGECVNYGSGSYTFKCIQTASATLIEYRHYADVICFDTEKVDENSRLQLDEQYGRVSARRSLQKHNIIH